jgi:hypothetical protein
MMKAVRYFLTICALLLGGAITPASAENAKLAMSAPIETCIRDNAAKVESAVLDLNQAVDFLVSNICAEPIAADQAEQAKAASEKQYAQWQKACDNAKVTAKDNDNSMSALCGNFRVGFLTEPNDDSTYTIYAAGSRPAGAVALASRLLLDLRLSHSNSRQSH